MPDRNDVMHTGNLHITRNGAGWPGPLPDRPHPACMDIRPAVGSNADPIGARPGKGIIGTWLGPGRQGREW